MGNGQGHIYGIQYDELVKQCKIINKEYSDKNYGKIQLLYNLKQHQYLALKEIIIANNDHNIKTVEMFKKRLELKHSNLICLQGFSTQEKQELCGTVFRSYLQIEHISKTLDKEIEQRKLYRQTYLEEDLWKFLSDMISGMAYLQENSMIHSNLKPSTIFINPSHTYKIAEKYLLNNDTCLSQVIAAGDYCELENKGIYLSPELLEAVKVQNWNPNHNQYKSDVFTLGVIVLQMVNMQSVQDLYNYEQCLISKRKLDHYQKTISILYSDSLYEIVDKMLNFQVDQRPDFIQLQVICNSQMVTQSHFPEKKNHNNSNFNNDYNLSKDIQSNQNGKNYEEKIFNKQVINTTQTKPTQLTDESNRSIQQSYGYTNLKKQVTIDPRFIISELDANKYNLQSNYANNNTQPCLITPKKLQYSGEQIKQKYKLTTNQNFFPSRLDQNDFLNQPNKLQFQTNQNNIDTIPTIPDENIKTAYGNENNIEQYVKQDFPNGAFYEGYLFTNKDKIKRGYGSFYYKDGGKYVGDWVNNKIEGKGTLFYKNGQKAYQGDWIQDQFHGHGTLWNENPQITNVHFDFNNFDNLNDKWEKYVGEFKCDVKNGQGILYLSNGERFQGNFSNDSIEGYGTYFLVNGQIVNGVWKQNKLLVLHKS